MLAALAATTVVGCRADIDAKTKSGAPLPAATDPLPETPADVIPDVPTVPKVPTIEVLKDPRTYYQSRSVIQLGLTEKLVGDATEFDLINSTNGKTLIERRPFGLGLALSDDEDAVPGTLALAGGAFDVVLRLYPIDDSLQGKLRYGKNKLTLRLSGDGDDRLLTTTISLQDFPIQGSGGTAFGEDVQVRGGFQGWVNTMVVPTVSNKTKLTTGMFNIVND